MSYQTQELLKAIRVEGESWQGVVHEQVESGRNFFLIFPEGEDALTRFCHSFNLQPDCLQGRWHAFWICCDKRQYVDGSAFDEMLIAWDAGDLVIFLEQLDFPINRPPRVKPFMVYSSLWGILSQHDDVRVARVWLEDSEQWGLDAPFAAGDVDCGTTARGTCCDRTQRSRKSKERKR